MMSWLALAVTAALAAAVALWWYGWREEEVRGRGLAAVLRGAALFLFLSAPWLPPLGVRPDADPRLAILVDHSASMRYPVGTASGASRIKAAREVVAELLQKSPSASVWSFAQAANRITPTELELLEATGEDSRVVGAIEQARASGADSIVVVTDGELTDREAGRRLAERFGIAAHEIRVAEAAGR
ncbi:MAG: VWA domain-containing protein, partial [Gemmatimonadetes bacterium]|nr:VWA domain-containing protein [Gemmatimonadota bacterium]